ncbi:uncharacterized protein Z518_10120 [Rhinocladiella mackenziei CBS 650.93]|uniref:DNA replication regulator SLD2 n=1 Tax=Rhinocladiella mackenziei CBS 650.93 TaxID=1442369 RepID=A0A0D2I5J8_9EURO|nr:uncharacterized protein Z518_10120 [Rhinocladiella mackenziei CBS 650.93]KIX01054.1 hypothetical protein Z518_10120 [Rhinocladiella mackenziei CBS 650.93]
MDDNVSLLDTPKRVSLQSQANTLRAELKDFERKFAAAHDDRKPGKDDIKADVAIAAKYKEYNKVRDVLAGKLGLDALNKQQSQPTRRRRGRTDSAISLTPHRPRKGPSPSKSHLHPNEVDPYDAPPSASPKVVFHAIGPTPRRDGTVLGIFDLLSNSGSSKTTQETPSCRKRKIDAFNNCTNDDAIQNLAVAQTPSQRRSKQAENEKENLLTITPGSRARRGRRQQSKTPVSEGKRFMLNHFFATPSAVPFATLIDGDEELHSEVPTETNTPLRDAILGLSPSKDNQGQATTNATPPYLKRSFSFKERLLSASRDSSTRSSSMISKTRSSTSAGARNLRHVTFLPKPLSQMIADLQNRHSTLQGDNDDDLEALREMESNELNVLINDGQAAEVPAGAGSQMTWKKKGQKRTTRRAIIRPVKMKVADAPKFVAAEDDDEVEPEDELAADSERAVEREEEISQVGETQLATAPTPSDRKPDDDSDLDRLIAEVEQEGTEQLSDPEDEFIPEPASPVKTRRGGDSKSEKVKSAKSVRPKKNTGDLIGKPASAKDSRAKTSKSTVEDGSGPGRVRTINPNAYTHMNFRTLKIKNKNSKAKYRGRFGRGRR